MKGRYWFSMLVSFVVLTGSISSVAAAAKGENQPSFRLAVDESGDHKLHVTVSASNLIDLYAYDLVLETDPGQLKLTDASSKIAGFAVGPKQEDGAIRFAVTEVGGAPGIDGDAALATFVFERTSASQAAVVRLIEAKLVDSALEMVLYKPGVRQSIAPGKALLWIDIAGYWAESAIRSAGAIGIVSGYEDGTFRPKRNVTRAEFAVMLARALDLPLPQDAKSRDGAEAMTASVPDNMLSFYADGKQIPEWSRAYLAAAVKAGLIGGYADSTIRPNQWITRAEISALIMRAPGMKAPGSETLKEADKKRGQVEGLQAEPPERMLALSDSRDIPAWARTYVAAAVNKGLMSGRGSGRFAPNELATRAEAVVVIWNMLNRVDSH